MAERDVGPGRAAGAAAPGAPDLQTNEVLGTALPNARNRTLAMSLGTLAGAPSFGRLLCRCTLTADARDTLLPMRVFRRLFGYLVTRRFAPCWRARAALALPADR